MDLNIESDEIKSKRMLNNSKSDSSKIVGSFASDIYSSVGIELSELDLLLKIADGKRDLDNLFGEELDKFIRDRTPLKRKKATDEYAEETDEEFKKRYREYINKPITSNNIYHYEKWAMEVEGVGGVKVIPTWKGPNSTKIIILGQDKKVPGEKLIKKVQNYIDPIGKWDALNSKWTSWGQGHGVASAGAFVTVEGAKIKEIMVSVNVRVNPNFDIEIVKEEFKNKLDDYFKEISFSGSEVSLAKVGCSLLNTHGIDDYYSLALNGVMENIKLEIDEIPVLKEVVFNGPE